MVGTIRIMSPERIERRDVDARSDLFSVGVVLHDATGSAPFDRGGAVETLKAVRHEAPPLLPGHVPASLAAIVTRCLEKDREQHFSRHAICAWHWTHSR